MANLLEKIKRWQHVRVWRRKLLRYAESGPNPRDPEGADHIRTCPICRPLVEELSGDAQQSDQPIDTICRAFLTMAVKEGADEVVLEPAPDKLRVVWPGSKRGPMDVPRYILAPVIFRMRQICGLSIFDLDAPVTGTATIDCGGAEHNVTVRIPSYTRWVLHMQEP